MYSDFSRGLTYSRKHLIIIYEIWELLISKNGSVPSRVLPLESLNSAPTSTTLPSISELLVAPFGTVGTKVCCVTIGKQQELVSYLLSQPDLKVGFY